MTAGKESEVLERLPQCHLFNYKSSFSWPGIEAGRRCVKPATNNLIYNTVQRIEQYAYYWELTSCTYYRWKIRKKPVNKK
jgi:hypothetical protein